MIELLYVLRRSEAARVQWADLDLARGIVSVLGKGGKRSWTVLTTAGIAALRQLRAEEPPAPDGYVFRSRQTGRAVCPDHLAHRLRALLTRAGLARPGRGPHALRRTFACLYWRRHPGDIRGLQQLMRHEHVATTCLYVYPDADELAARAAGIFDAPATPGGPHAL